MTHPEGESREQAGRRGFVASLTNYDAAMFLYMESQFRQLTLIERTILDGADLLADANSCKCVINQKGQVRRFRNCPQHGTKSP